MDPRTCHRCGGDLQDGYVPDGVREGIMVLTWVPGAPERSWLAGIKRKRGVSMVARRCQNCGVVEFVAPAPPSTSKG